MDSRKNHIKTQTAPLCGTRLIFACPDRRLAVDAATLATPLQCTEWVHHGSLSDLASKGVGQTPALDKARLSALRLRTRPLATLRAAAPHEQRSRQTPVACSTEEETAGEVEDGPEEEEAGAATEAGKGSHCDEAYFACEERTERTKLIFACPDRRSRNSGTQTLRLSYDR